MEEPSRGVVGGDGGERGSELGVDGVRGPQRIGAQMPFELAPGRLDGSTVLRAALGDAVVDHYLHSFRWEQAQYDAAVTDWELIRYFERG
jgi:hypothetical protein